MSPHSRTARPAIAGKLASMILPLSLVGLAVSVYLLIDHYTATAPLACPEGTVVNCERVTTSPQSMILGLPVALFGVVYFVAMATLSWPGAWPPRNRWTAGLRAGLATGGVASVIYLVYVELFIVDAICLWCTAVHALVLAIFAGVAISLAVDPDPL
jgi:uncharacterized membrane protein